MDQQMLISAIEKIPALYDKTDKHYSNRNYVTAAWKQVAEEVGCPENDARKHWTKLRLRDYFRKCHGEMTSQKSGSAGGKKRWYLYDNMLFVLPHLVDRKTQSNLSSSEDEEVLHFDEASQASSVSCAFSEINSPTPSLGACSLSPVLGGAYSQRRSSPPPQNQRNFRAPKFPQERGAKATDLDAHMVQTLTDLSQNQEKMNNDEDLMFFKSLIPKMKLLTATDKMECQYEMHTLLMRYISNSRVQSSSPPLRPDSSPQPRTNFHSPTLQGSHYAMSKTSATYSPPGNFEANNYSQYYQY